MHRWASKIERDDIFWEGNDWWVLEDISLLFALNDGGSLKCLAELESYKNAIKMKERKS